MSLIVAYIVRRSVSDDERRRRRASKSASRVKSPARCAGSREGLVKECWCVVSLRPYLGLLGRLHGSDSDVDTLL